MSQSMICVDAGTTNTRVWLVENDRILARAQAGVGVRDTARDGSPARLHAALRDLIAEVRANAEPEAVIAAGMITSSLGLADVPHAPAPAGLADLARQTKAHRFPAVTDLPVLLVPGVRTGARPCDLATARDADLMRGEETLCLGLVATGRLQTPGVVLNLGSHWKTIRIDPDGRIAASVTSLSGELVHAAQTQTILASAVPHDRPAEIDAAWRDAGMAEARHAGLARALFCVRLLEQSAQGSPAQRLSFLVGAFLASELDALLRTGVLVPGQPVALTGGGALADAWRSALDAHAIPARIVGPEETEDALLAGLRRVKEMMNAAGASCQ